MASQFFLKNVHFQMRNSASTLFGSTEFLRSRPNVIGELLRVMISPSPDVEKAVNWTINGGQDPHISVHMRMLMNRYFEIFRLNDHVNVKLDVDFFTL